MYLNSQTLKYPSSSFRDDFDSLYDPIKLRMILGTIKYKFPI